MNAPSRAPHVFRVQREWIGRLGEDASRLISRYLIQQVTGKRDSDNPRGIDRCEWLGRVITLVSDKLPRIASIPGPVMVDIADG